MYRGTSPPWTSHFEWHTHHFQHAGGRTDWVVQLCFSVYHRSFWCFSVTRNMTWLPNSMNVLLPSSPSSPLSVSLSPCVFSVNFISICFFLCLDSFFQDIFPEHFSLPKTVQTRFFFVKVCLIFSCVSRPFFSKKTSTFPFHFVHRFFRTPNNVRTCSMFLATPLFHVGFLHFLHLCIKKLVDSFELPRCYIFHFVSN